MQSPYHHNYQNRTGYHPYDSTQSTSKSSKQFKYMISVGRKHIVFFLFLMMSIFGMFFILGLFTGYKVGKNTNPSIVADANLPAITTNTEYAYDNYNNFDANVLNNNLSNGDSPTQDNLEFVSESVATDVVANEEEVLQISGKDAIAPVEKPTPKQPVAQTQVKPRPTEKPAKTSPYVRVPVPGVQYYYIQVIATEDIDRARNIYQRLKVRSFPVHVKQSTKNDKMLYAIRVGLYKTRGLANKHLRRIRNGGGYKSAFMKPYKVDEP